MKNKSLGQAVPSGAGNPPVTRGKPPARCPCFGQVPTAKAPLGTACKQPPVTGRDDGLCPYHAEMFDGIDRRSTLGLRRELAEDVPYGDASTDDDE